MSKNRRPQRRKTEPRTSWTPVANWYNGWVGSSGSEHHRQLAIPMVLDLLQPWPGMKVLEIGAGQGVLAPVIAEADARYVGIDASERLLQFARKYHGRQGKFICGDARYLKALPDIQANSFDAVIFMLSIQDMEPLDQVLEPASWALKPGGSLILLMTHPCFRVPHQSGWGWDENRKLQYRRIDRYLTRLRVPMRAYPGQRKGTTLSFHRPLGDYINTLADCGLQIDRMQEVPTYKRHNTTAKSLADQEIPLFLGLRARKVTQ
jgi:ubiquinone/menaquinone biosynthesis C-methylase UbiE